MLQVNKKIWPIFLCVGLITQNIGTSFVGAKLLSTDKKESSNLSAKVVSEVDGEIRTSESQKERKTIFHELIHENLRPDANEFYLSTIYGTSKNPRALIKRSQNLRAGELYNGNVEYGIGDKIASDLEIVEINFRHREVIVQDLKTKEYYGLKLSYGQAVSRLIKKPNYAPLVSQKETLRHNETKPEELKQKI
jgi:hypothetical protein